MRGPCACPRGRPIPVEFCDVWPDDANWTRTSTRLPPFSTSAPCPYRTGTPLPVLVGTYHQDAGRKRPFIPVFGRQTSSEQGRPCSISVSCAIGNIHQNQGRRSVIFPDSGVKIHQGAWIAKAPLRNCIHIEVDARCISCDRQGDAGGRIRCAADGSADIDGIVAREQVSKGKVTGTVRCYGLYYGIRAV